MGRGFARLAGKILEAPTRRLGLASLGFAFELMEEIRYKGLPPLLRPPTGLAPAGRRPGRRPLASPLRSSLCQPLANSSQCYGQGARAPVLPHLTTKNDRILTPESLPELSIETRPRCTSCSLVEVAPCRKLG
jgi:hypothetical protein